MIADTLDHLGLFYLTRKRLQDAGPLFVEAVKIREDVLGKNHPTTARSMENLARLRDAEGHDAEAEKLYDQSIAAFLDIPVAARDGCLRYAQRAQFYHKTNHFEKAVADQKRAIELSMEVRKNASGTDEQRSRTFAGFYMLFETMVDWQYEHGDMKPPPLAASVLLGTVRTNRTELKFNRNDMPHGQGSVCRLGVAFHCPL